MKAYLAKLNPAERRFVVGVALVVFIVINLVFIWPHYSDLSTWGNRRAAAESQIGTYEAKIAQAATIEPQLKKLEGAGADVPAEEQSVRFLQTIQTQAAQSGVTVTATGRQITRTNSPFFLEQVQTVTVQSGEEQLVNFLYNLGAGDSLVRVRDLVIRPDQGHHQLIAQVTLVASFQKAQKTRAPARAPAAAPKAEPKPASSKPAAKTAPATPPQTPSPGRTVPPRPGISRKP